jgi:hypothetical protein
MIAKDFVPYSGIRSFAIMGNRHGNAASPAAGTGERLRHRHRLGKTGGLITGDAQRFVPHF